MEVEALDIRALLGLPDLLAVRTLVCVQPHPDDNEVGAAGTLLELVGRGCEVVYVTVTDGGAGAFGEVTDREVLVALRSQEILDAGAVVGVKRQVNLGFPDGGDYTEEQVREKLVEVFREVRPEIVMTVDPWMPYEAHPDHVKTGLAVARAAMFCDNAVLYPVGERPLWSVPQVAFYASSHPNTFVDVSVHWQDKGRAMLAHKSQFDNEQWPVLWGYLSMSAKALFDQHLAGPEASGHAEAFKVLATRQLHFYPSAIYE